ncbi:DUF1642 domain-containing protein [Lactococcus lactis]|uniref:DUF1642 domain-containing protein n=1 Tax=Lactococcus lactis TaxID=1358 RepID=UPI003A800222
MTKNINVTCEKCKESFIFEAKRSVVDKVLEEGHYICFTCQDEMDEDKMTKFEEEFKALISWDWVNVDLIQQILTRFGNWHSDEEFQAKEKEIKRLRKINHLYKKAKGNAERLAVDRGERLNQAQDELASLESQLQQQALPVVPDFVADWYEGHMNGTFSAVVAAYALTGDDKAVVWLGENGGMDLLCKMKLDGYTVEKSQLFYLKHIDMSKSDAHLNWYLAKGTDNVLIHQGIKKGKSPKLKCILKLTQQEIDSMQTGSYEQIPVPVEDGE